MKWAKVDLGDDEDLAVKYDLFYDDEEKWFLGTVFRYYGERVFFSSYQFSGDIDVVRFKTLPEAKSYAYNNALNFIENVIKPCVAQT